MERVYIAKDLYLWALEHSYHDLSEFFGSWKRIWRYWAPDKCYFFMWLFAPAQNTWWIANRLAWWGLPHPEHRLLCDQHEETLNHLLASSLFTKTFQLNLQPDEFFFSKIGGQLGIGWNKGAYSNKKGLNSVVMLGAWSIWKHRNNCVFDVTFPDVASALLIAMEKLHDWDLARVEGISCLLDLLLEPGHCLVVVCCFSGRGHTFFICGRQFLYLRL